SQPLASACIAPPEALLFGLTKTQRSPTFVLVRLNVWARLVSRSIFSGDTAMSICMQLPGLPRSVALSLAPFDVEHAVTASSTQASNPAPQRLIAPTSS